MDFEEKVAGFFSGANNTMNEEREVFDGRLKKFFSDLHFRVQIFKDAKKEFDLYLAGDFNVVEWIAPDRAEKGLSDLIAMLLTPDGEHGQCDVFLKSFLDIFCKGNRIFNDQQNKIAKWKIDTESPTNKNPDYPNRRIDITIDGGGFGIGIENKPKAGDQEKQLEDYSKHLKRKYNGEYILIYLAEKGRNPESGSITPESREDLEKRGRFLIASYQVELKRWLELCYRECKAEKVRWLLKDFIDYINGNFANSKANLREDEKMSKSEKDIIIQYATANSGNFEMALKISKNCAEIKRSAISRFFGHLKPAFMAVLNENERKWLVNDYRNEEGDGIAIQNNGRAYVEYLICADYEGTVVYFGIKNKPEGKSEAILQRIDWKKRLTEYAKRNVLVDDGVEGWLWGAWTWKKYDTKDDSIFLNYFNLDKGMSKYYVECITGLINETEQIIDAAEKAK